MNELEIENLRSYASMLGQIANLVEDYCETEENTTIEAVEKLIHEKNRETSAANHYCRKLYEAKKLGYLPDDYEF